MADINVASAIHTFMQSADAAAMRTNIGFPLTTCAWTSITFSGAYTFAGTLSGNTSVTFPTSGTLATLTGLEAFTNKTLTSPILTTPAIGSAGCTFAGSTSGTTTLKASATASGTLTLPATTDTIAVLDLAQTFTGVKTFVAPVLGVATCTTINGVTISSAGTLALATKTFTLATGNVTLTAASGAGSSVTLPASGTLYGTGSGTITSLQLKTSLTDETGSGSAVFATSPTLVSPVLGNASGSSLLLSGSLQAGSTVVTDLVADSVASASILSTGSLTSQSATSGVGYAGGAGGSVASGSVGGATPNWTATLNKVCGRITIPSLTTAGGAEEFLVVTNSTMDAEDVVIVGTTYSGAGDPVFSVKAIGTNTFTIVVTNVSASAFNATMPINFAIIKAVTS